MKNFLWGSVLVSVLVLAGGPVFLPFPPEKAESGEGGLFLPVPGDPYRTLEKDASYVQEGTGPRTIWIFLNPDCIWCNRLYSSLGTLKRPDSVNIRWVLVGVAPDTRGKAEHILRGGLAPLEKNEHGFDPVRERGAVSPIHNPALARKIKMNTMILALLDHGTIQTPTLVFDTAEGPRMVLGFPEPALMERIMKEAL